MFHINEWCYSINRNNYLLFEHVCVRLSHPLSVVKRRKISVDMQIIKPDNFV